MFSSNKDKQSQTKEDFLVSEDGNVVFENSLAALSTCAFRRTRGGNISLLEKRLKTPNDIIELIKQQDVDIDGKLLQDLSDSIHEIDRRLSSYLEKIYEYKDMFGEQSNDQSGSDQQPSDQKSSDRKSQPMNQTIKKSNKNNRIDDDSNIVNNNKRNETDVK